MTSPPPPDDPCRIWQSQPAAPHPVLPETVRAEASRFQRTIQWRNLREYLASIFVVAIFGWQLVKAVGLAARIGPALVIAGTLFIVHRLRTRGSADRLPPEALAESCLAFHRRALERQRDLLRTIWRWYLGPLIPGLAFMLAESAWRAPEPARLLKIGAFALFCALMFLAIGWVNRLAARQLDQELRALEAEETRP